MGIASHPDQNSRLRRALCAGHAVHSVGKLAPAPQVEIPDSSIEPNSAAGNLSA